ncbi:hypothetical protein N7456_013421 [Penicillium angulare]|uniref:Fatty acid desaturase domain-containing protein n=1 Tax=Penicillium angulare TaxID=116970 RepID=A0A9W9EG32_9EURO|nr:hypothetical protein N7456_013421 [Penicillium angulare]
MTQTEDVADLDLRTLKAAIPQVCFRPSLPTSLLYLLRDIGYSSVLIYFAFQIGTIPWPWARYFTWTCYGFAQGCVGVGFWILAHECGHGAFSLYPRVNNIIGFILHSALLVPYFSWKTTHARHHRFAGHMDKDTVFVPFTEDEYANHFRLSFIPRRIIECMEDAPVVALGELLLHQLFGWPMYLFFNVSAGVDSLPSQDRESRRRTSHFNPFGVLFTTSQWPYVLLSDLGLVVTGCILVALCTKFGLQHVSLLYFLPYIWTNHWIVSITYLHHTHPSVPHYGNQSWSYLRGSLSTVDRTAGLLGRHFFHDIIDFHVVHHLFPKIPFYRAEEATRAIQPFLGSHYHEQKHTSFLWSLYCTFRLCNFVSKNRPALPNEGEDVFRWKLDKVT